MKAEPRHANTVHRERTSSRNWPLGDLARHTGHGQKRPCPGFNGDRDLLSPPNRFVTVDAMRPALKDGAPMNLTGCRTTAERQKKTYEPAISRPRPAHIGTRTTAAMAARVQRLCVDHCGAGPSPAADRGAVLAFAGASPREAAQYGRKNHPAQDTGEGSRAPAAAAQDARSGASGHSRASSDRGAQSRTGATSSSATSSSAATSSATSCTDACTGRCCSQQRGAAQTV